MVVVVVCFYINDSIDETDDVALPAFCAVRSSVQLEFERTGKHQ